MEINIWLGKQVKINTILIKKNRLTCLKISISFVNININEKDIYNPHPKISFIK